jgi:hypothetical protein
VTDCQSSWYIYLPFGFKGLRFSSEIVTRVHIDVIDDMVILVTGGGRVDSFALFFVM